MLRVECKILSVSEIGGVGVEYNTWCNPWNGVLELSEVLKVLKWNARVQWSVRFH